MATGTPSRMVSGGGGTKGLGQTHTTASQDTSLLSIFSVHVFLVGFCSWNWIFNVAPDFNPGRGATSCCRFIGNIGEDLLCA